MADWKEEIRRRLAGLSLSPAREAEIVEELSQHLDDRYRELRQQGATIEEAISAVLIELSNDSGLLARELRKVEHAIPSELPVLGASKRRNMIADLRQDLEYGARMLRKSPGFTATAILTLALGIGANTAIFSAVYNVLLKPLPFFEPSRLVVLDESHSGKRLSISWPDFVDWRDRASSFQGFAAFHNSFFNLTGREEAVRLYDLDVTWNFFDVLGVKPALGRTFSPNDDRMGAPPTLVISNSIWQSVFGGDPNIVGQAATLDGKSFTIVGVLPAAFEFLYPQGVFAPIEALMEKGSSILDRGNHQSIRAVARLKPGVSLEQARADMKVVAAGLEQQYPATNSGNTSDVIGLQDRMVQRSKNMLLVLMGAVILVLLIACANLANLLLARGASRRHEISVRLAIGARRSRITRQLLTESILLAALGGASGVVVGNWFLKLFRALAPEGLPRLADARLDLGVLVFAIGLSLVCGILFGIVPSLQASRTDLQAALKQSARTTAQGGARPRSLNTLLVIEVSLAVLLLAGAGLMMRTLNQLARVDAGFRYDHLLTMKFERPAWKSTEESNLAFYSELESHIQSTPGVTSAALTSSLPIDGSNWNSVFIVADQPVPARADLPTAAFTPISAGYFNTMGIRLQRGRVFSNQDRPDSPGTTVINEALARRFWPDEEPIGKRLKQGWPESRKPWLQVVGVVADVKTEDLTSEVPMQAYLPLTQHPVRSLIMAVRTEREPQRLATDVVSAIHSLDHELPVYDIFSMEQLMGRSILTQRIAATLLGSFAGLAIVLAAVGIYGVVSSAASRRSHELGLRMALGAGRRQVLGMIIRQSMAPVLIGSGLGIVGALVLTRFMSTLLFHVKTTDSMTLIAVPLILVVVALAACYLPARRAVDQDPLVALRYE
jgi:putative ABC transport system permease protein